MNAADLTLPPRSRETYWLTRFVLLRWLGFVYLVAFFVAVRQLVPLVGAHGLTPATIFLDQVRAQAGSTQAAFFELPMLFWFLHSDAALQIVPWIGLVLAALMLAGYANSITLAVMWVLYLSIVHVGQDWYGYGWEIQLLETGFLAIFFVPLLDPRPFPSRAPPMALIWLFRWLIFRIMLGSALIKLRGDACWTDLTALYYFFETQPIPNPTSRWFHFLPHAVLQVGTVLCFVAELVAPWFAFWPRWGRLGAGVVMIGFQLVLIVCGNLSFFNWLTIVPALACFDDHFLRWFLPPLLVERAAAAARRARPSRLAQITSYVLAALIAFLSIEPVLNLFSPHQMMNSSSFDFDQLHLVNTYGAFGSIGRERLAIIFEGSDSPDPATATDWKEYTFAAAPCAVDRPPIQIAPYQPHLDWQLWFAAMASPREYPWTLNLVWKLLHNDPATLSLFARHGNPFPDHPPRFIRAVYYRYHFARPGNPEHVYWTRDRLGLWLKPLSADNPDLRTFLQEAGWLGK
jgi:hypothetical protein